MAILELSNVTMRFGGLIAVNDVSFAVDPGQLYGLIGPNGAGKTTVFNVITGVYRPTAGKIVMDGESLGGKRTGRITRHGVARTFQNIRLFSNMTVVENVKVAFHCRQTAHLGAAMLRTRTHAAEEERVDRESRELLKIFHLDHLAEETAKNLPYGSQRRLEIARAMATSPRLLLLDEPAAGMNPQEANELMDLIRWIRDQFGMAVLLVEHNMKVVMGICETVHVLDYGSTIAVGPPAKIQKDPKVIEAYLGGSVTGAGAAPILEVSDLVVSYGAIKALKGISIRLMPDEIVTLIGANGAGKSTTLRAIVGLVAPTSGEIRFHGGPTRGTPTYKLVRQGLILVPEGRAIFANLSVRENLEMGAYARRDREVGADFEKVFRIFPRLKERLRQTAGTLSGGEQQMLAIGRALMSRPKVLLLDEPSLGLAPLLVHTIFEAIEEIHKEGTPVLLVEQNANAALRHSNRAYVLETGSVALEGSSADVAANPRVKEAYLGE